MEGQDHFGGFVGRRDGAAVEVEEYGLPQFFCGRRAKGDDVGCRLDPLHDLAEKFSGYGVGEGRGLFVLAVGVCGFHVVGCVWGYVILFSAKIHTPAADLLR